MKKSEWLDCQRNEFFPKQKGIPSLVKIEHKNTATLDSARSKKKSKVAVLQLGPNKPFQTQKHHNLLSVLRLGSGQPVQRSQLLCLWGGVLEANLIIHHNLVFAIGRGSGQLWQVPLPFSYGSMFGIACLKRPNQHSFAFCNKGRFGQAFSNK